MIAPVELELKFSEWNKKWGSPWGFQRHTGIRGFIYNKFRKFVEPNDFLKMLIAGPFAFQPNSSTRAFEYPWAYYATHLKQGMKIVDVGGGLSGFQFVLAKNKMNVINIDPSDPDYKWTYKKMRFDNLNKYYGTRIELNQNTLDNAEIEDNSTDRVYCISVMEHLQPKEREVILKESYRILKVNGYFIMTVDLFLDIFPFSNKKSNKWGSNMNINTLIKNSSFTLVQGLKKELYGFPEFKVTNIMANLNNYLIGATYPVLTQALVLQKK